MYRAINDYYGQEVDMITLKPLIADNVDYNLTQLNFKTISKKIEYILQLEYGHLIPSVINREWKIVQADLSQMIFSNLKHFQECSKQKLPYLKNYKLPRGIAIQQSDGRYKVVDGYHRICSVTDEKFLIIVAV